MIIKIESKILNKLYLLDNINYIFCDNNYILNINKNYLNHNYYTDVITFNNSLKNDIISADIYISIESVLFNSFKFSQKFEKEIKRVIAHAILHLLGYNDRNQIETNIMRNKENYYINLFP